MANIVITKRILSYIDNNLDKNLTLDKIAKELHYSKFYIGRIFKDTTGITLHKYIQSRRLNEAAKKLVKTRKPIIEIALESGYSSQQAFTQAFRYEYMYTPQEYRRIGIFLPRQSRINMSTNRRFIFFSLAFKGGKEAA